MAGARLIGDGLMRAAMSWKPESAGRSGIWHRQAAEDLTRAVRHVLDHSPDRDAQALALTCLGAGDPLTVLILLDRLQETGDEIHATWVAFEYAWVRGGRNVPESVRQLAEEYVPF